MRTRTGVAEVPLSVETQLELTSPEEQTNINVLSARLEAKGLDASDFIDVINELANIERRDAAKEEKDAEKEGASKQKKIFADKEFVHETRQDVLYTRTAESKTSTKYHFNKKILPENCGPHTSLHKFHAFSTDDRHWGYQEIKTYDFIMGDIKQYQLQSTKTI